MDITFCSYGDRATHRDPATFAGRISDLQRAGEYAGKNLDPQWQLDAATRDPDPVRLTAPSGHLIDDVGYGACGALKRRPEKFFSRGVGRESGIGRARLRPSPGRCFTRQKRQAQGSAGAVWYLSRLCS